MGATERYESVWFGDTHGPEPFEFIVLISQTQVMRVRSTPSLRENLAEMRPEALLRNIEYTGDGFGGGFGVVFVDLWVDLFGFLGSF